MVMYVTVISDLTHKEEYFHVGAGRLDHINPYTVVSVQADGHELDKIKEQFDNLPTPNGRVARWYRDLAAMIVGNIKL